jgi:hypothetical protein
VGEKHNQAFQLSFNASLKVDFQGSRVTSDGGLMVARELDERLGLGALIAQHVTDARRGENTQFPLADEGTELTVSGAVGALQEQKLLPTAPHEAHGCTLL